MAKNSVAEYDSTPANNTDVGGISIIGGSIPSKFDDSQRQIMAHLRDEHDAVYALLGKNRVINGGHNINQQGVSGTVVLAAGDYGHDMWKAGSSGCTYTFATVNNVTTITITAGSLQQIIDGEFLESGTYCLSWSGTAQGKINAGSYSSTGVTGTATGGTNLTIEFNTGTLSKVSLIEGSIAGNYKPRLKPLELMLCQYKSGVFSEENKPAFSASIYGDNTVKGTNTLVSVTSALVNTGNHFNTGTARFTAPVKGVYKATMIGACSGVDSRHAFFVNGVVYRYSISLGGGTLHTQGIDCLISLNQGDYVELLTIAGYTSLFSDSAYSTWSMHLL